MDQIRITLDMEEARANVADAINAYCGGVYEYLSQRAAEWAFLVHAPCVLCTEADNQHAQDAADLMCLGDELIPFVNGLAKASGMTAKDMAARIIPPLVAINARGHNALAIARRHYGITVDRFPRRDTNGADVIEISGHMGARNV